MRVRARTAMLVAGLAPAFVLSVATPAVADTQACSGIAPLTTTCSRNGTLGTTTWTAQHGPALGFTGTLLLTVSTATGYWERTVTYQGGLVTNPGSPSQTGTFYVSQSYTLTGTANGTGHWQVAVVSP